MRPAPGDRVSFSHGIRMADGVVRIAGAAMFAIEPDDPGAFSEMDDQGRVWRYEHELGPLGQRPPTDVVIGGCPHGEPHPSACPECVDTTPSPAAAEEPERLMGQAFGARWPGTCPGCDLPITPGQSVVRTTRKRYFHEGRCAP